MLKSTEFTELNAEYFEEDDYIEFEKHLKKHKN